MELQITQSIKNHSICFYIKDQITLQVLAEVQAIEADQTGSDNLKELPQDQLRRAIFLEKTWVKSEMREVSHLSLLGYLIMTYYRSQGRQYLIAEIPHEDSSLMSIFRFHPIHQTQPVLKNHNYWLGAQQFDYATHRATLNVEPDLWPLAVANGIIPEIFSTIERRLEKFYGNAWFEQVKQKRLSREQYIETLSDNYQFARFRTRILGKVVGMTEDAELRRHYCDHLRGEINYELLIENDLRYLGADIDYVKKSRPPSVAISGFMNAQESSCSFHQDPIAFLGIPIAIEAVTSHLKEDFTDRLHQNIRLWNVSDPNRATTYFQSHIEADESDQSYWKQSQKMILKYVNNETTNKRILNSIHITFNALDQAFEDYAKTLKF